MYDSSWRYKKCSPFEASWLNDRHAVEYLSEHLPQKCLSLQSDFMDEWKKWFAEHPQVAAPSKLPQRKHCFIDDDKVEQHHRAFMAKHLFAECSSRGRVINVFYNVYVPPNPEKVREIVKDQIRVLRMHDRQLIGRVKQQLEEGHVFDIRVVTIGNREPILPKGCRGCETEAHYDTGTEAVTLQHMYEFCMKNRGAEVMYLHNKGSLHDTPQNKLFRNFLMEGTVHDACLNMPTSCNVCSGRFSPMPHPHVPGNMFVSKCRYISRLVPPKDFEKKMDDLLQAPGAPPRPYEKLGDGAGMGIKRFANEHWINSHPTVVPCDLYGGDYLFGYDGMPAEGSWSPQRVLGARFPLNKWNMPWIGQKADLKVWRTWRCFEYNFLYNESISEPTWMALGMNGAGPVAPDDLCFDIAAH
eukprot:gb/GFBE01014318.1/.p1 GENE.gb/GFBE01014318.1/~~gb/GFBE01014318.1/.p1  ORF type:complete len:412 (+),score=59.95 gb/GFBE01014318.1/:1-1236(+)